MSVLVRKLESAYVDTRDHLCGHLPLLLCLVQRLGGKVEIEPSEIRDLHDAVIHHWQGQDGIWRIELQWKEAKDAKP